MTMSDQTTALALGLSRPVTVEGQLPQERREGAISLSPHTESASAADRDAILSSLYAERSGLTRARRLGGLSPQDAEYLSELEAYIDHWEAAEAHEATQQDDVWRRLDEIAGSLLGVQASIEQQRR